MSVHKLKGLAIVSNRGERVTSGTAVMSGFTARGPQSAVNLTVTRTSATSATLTGGVSAMDDGRTSLTMTRKGQCTDIVGTIGFLSPFKTVALRVEQQTFGRSTLTGTLCGLTVNLSLERQAGVTTVSGTVYPYPQTHVGPTSITIRDTAEGRTFEGSTSKKPEGAVKLTEVRDGDLLVTRGKLAGWDVTELSQPASIRDLELFDTTLLVILTQALRRHIADI